MLTVEMLTVGCRPIMMAPFCTQHSIDKSRGPCEDDLVGQTQPADTTDSERGTNMPLPHTQSGNRRC